jgi:TPR repeat protein
MMQPVFSAALVGADNLIPSALLNMAMTAPGDMSEADQLRVAQALATGEGAPRSVRTAAAMLKPLADGGNADAALHYASLLQAEGTNPDGAYEYALIAGKGGAAGVRSVLDHIESDLSIQSILDLQAAAAGELPAPEADMSALRNGARQYAHGRGATRNYGRAMLLATLAAAGGDHNSHLLVERLSKRFADDEDADVWRAMEATQAETALRLWAEGFGDGFGVQ